MITFWRSSGPTVGFSLQFKDQRTLSPSLLPRSPLEELSPFWNNRYSTHSPANLLNLIVASLPTRRNVRRLWLHYWQKMLPLCPSLPLLPYCILFPLQNKKGQNAMKIGLILCNTGVVINHVLTIEDLPRFLQHYQVSGHSASCALKTVVPLRALNSLVLREVLHFLTFSGFFSDCANPFEADFWSRQTKAVSDRICVSSWKVRTKFTCRWLSAFKLDAPFDVCNLVGKPTNNVPTDFPWRRQNPPTYLTLGKQELQFRHVLISLC